MRKTGQTILLKGNFILRSYIFMSQGHFIEVKLEPNCKFFVFKYAFERERESIMSDQRRCDIMTSLRHWYKIVLRLCAH